MKSTSVSLGRWSGTTKRPTGEFERFNLPDDKLDRSQKLRRLQSGRCDDASRSKTPTFSIRSRTPCSVRGKPSVQDGDPQKSRSRQQVVSLLSNSNPRSKSAPRNGRGRNIESRPSGVVEVATSSKSSQKEHIVCYKSATPSCKRSLIDKSGTFFSSAGSVSDNITEAISPECLINQVSRIIPAIATSNASACFGNDENVENHVLERRVASTSMLFSDFKGVSVSKISSI
jgi:hypothetical protein